MSRLYASIDSDARKTQATSRGHKSMNAHIRGWNSGVEVHAYVDEVCQNCGEPSQYAAPTCPDNGGPHVWNDRDVFEVYRTGGSNGGLAPRMVARIVGDTVERMESGERLNVAGAITADGPQPAPGTPEGWGVDWV